MGYAPPGRLAAFAVIDLVLTFAPGAVLRSRVALNRGGSPGGRKAVCRVITSYSIHYTKLYEAGNCFYRAAGYYYFENLFTFNINELTALLYSIRRGTIKLEEN